MNPDDVFHKTTRGQAEIAVKTGALDIKQRRVLILVNGENSVATLAQIALGDDLGEILERLLEGGFITLPGAGAAESARPANGASTRGDPDAGETGASLPRSDADVTERDLTAPEIGADGPDTTQTEIDVTERDLTQTEIDITERDIDATRGD